MKVVSHAADRLLVPTTEPTEDVAVFTMLRRARRDHGLTQAELAKLVGVNRYTITRWETHQTGFPIHQVIRVAVILGVQLGDLLEWRYCVDGGPRERASELDTYNPKRSKSRKGPVPHRARGLKAHQRRF